MLKAMAYKVRNQKCGNLALSAMIGWIEFRCADPYSVENYVHEGVSWWRTSYAHAADDIGVPLKHARTLLDNAESIGAIESAKHFRDGPWDQMKSYRVVDEWSIPALMTLADSGKCFADLGTTPMPISANVPYRKEVVKNTTAFDTWWKLYPRRLVKAAAEKAYKKALDRGVSENELLQAVEAFKVEWDSKSKDDLKFCPYASTWLNQDRWQDYVVDASERLVEAERLVAAGEVSKLGDLLGTKVRPPNFDGSPFEVRPQLLDWLQTWWLSDGRKLLG